MEVLQDYLIGIDENNLGRIVFVQPATDLGSLAQQWSFNQNDVDTLTDSQFLMPGLVDCHIHPSQFFKDGVDYSSFLELLVDAFFPGSVMFENTTYAREESMKIVRRTLRFGTTTISHAGPRSVSGTVELARVINELGQRTVIQVESFDMVPGALAAIVPPSFRVPTTEEALRDARRFVDMIRDLENPLIQPSVAPNMAITASSELVQGLGEIVNETGVLVQVYACNSSMYAGHIESTFISVMPYTPVSKL